MSNISSVLFACDHNAVRSPMAEGIMKKYYGTAIYVQSAGVMHDMEIDGFSIAVCAEIGVELEKHRTRSFEDMRDWGDAVDGYDLIIALSPASYALALEQTKLHDLTVESWAIPDPSGSAEGREQKLVAYRAVRDEIARKIVERFGEPTQNVST